MKGNILSTIGACLSALFLFQTSTFSATIYVNHAAVGANNGTSWANAYTSLNTALTAAVNGDEVWVAQGVYKPSQTFDFNGDAVLEAREVTFTIPGGVILYGGFIGTEALVSERNLATNLTILSGDIDNNDLNADADFIAETTSDIVGNNAYHVLFTNNVNNTTRVDGFIITAGSANSATPLNSFDPNLDGGGWYNLLSSPAYSSSPGIYNTSFQGNYATSEGGAFFNFSAPTGGTILSVIENCTFTGNKSNNTAGAIYLGSFQPGNYQPQILNCWFENNEAFRRGGAIYLVGDHSTIENSTFINNSATAISPDNSTLPGSGGAVNLVVSNASFVECMFEGNHATGNPTGAYEGGGGGAVHISTNEPQTNDHGASEPRFVGCGFYSNLASDNTGAWGGAIVHLCDGGMLNPSYINCVFYDNEAQNHGGAIANFIRVISTPEGYIPVLSPQITNCTFTENHALQRGGAIYNDGQVTPDGQVLQSSLVNSILWNNTAGVEGPEIYNDGEQSISYSLIQGSGGSGGGWDTDLGTDGGNNIDEDPEFVDAAVPKGGDNLPATNDDGLRLSAGSPAINEGNNAAPGLAGITTDYRGQTRILSSVVEIGAYEYTGIVVPDFDFLWLENWWDFIDPNPCLTCPPPWAFLLLERVFPTPEFVWKEKAQFYVDGENAYITGEIVNRKLPNSSFKVNIKLEKQVDWETWKSQGGTWFAITPEAYRTAKSEHANWKFWSLSAESYIEATGDIQGKIYLKPLVTKPKTGFQIGKGANSLDSDLGIGGYFTISGQVKVKGKYTRLYGIGSMNVDAIPCEGGCVPERIESPIADLKTFDDFENSVNTGVGLFPVPANNTLTIIADSDDKQYQISIADLAGRVKYTANWSSSEGDFKVMLDDFDSGIYVLHLISADGENIVKKFIVDKE